MMNTRDTTTPSCKTMRRKVFNGGAICYGCESDKHVRRFTRSEDRRILRPLQLFVCRIPCLGGGIIRWLATTLAPDVCDRLVGEEQKKWAEENAQSYLLARVEARAMEAYSTHCVGLCNPGPGRVSARPILQFGGSGSTWDPSLPTSRAPKKMQPRGILRLSSSWLKRGTFSRMAKLDFPRVRLSDL